MNNDTIRPISISGTNNLEVENIDFKYNINLDLSIKTSKELVRSILLYFKQDTTKVMPIPINHVTWSDGSESDLWGYSGSFGSEKVVLAISHKWIDPHFLTFWLWLPDRHRYPIDYLFGEFIREEAMTDWRKFGEVLVAPCMIKISTVENDPKNFLPTEDVLRKLCSEAKESPSVKFWRSFKENKYKTAASYVSKMRKLYDKENSQHAFLGTVEALCHFNDGQNKKAIKLFTQMASYFHSKGLEMNCNMCLFFAIEAAKKIGELTQSINSMKWIAQRIPNLSPYQRNEVSGILKNYSISVYIGVVALCRRIIEMALRDILSERCNTSVENLIKDCVKSGVLKGRPGPGLYPILVVAKWKEIINEDDFNVAKKIKDFGDRIHDRGGVRNAIDAKFAIQACIRILRQLKCPQDYTKKYPMWNDMKSAKLYGASESSRRVLLEIVAPPNTS
jgi:hypothetical protein